MMSKSSASARHTKVFSPVTSSPLSSREVSGILQRGGTVLQTARNEEFKTPQGQKQRPDAG